MKKNRPPPVFPHPGTGTVLAFDFGEKRIGVATGELSTGIAHALTTIAGEDNRTRFAAVAALIDEWRPVELVVGVAIYDDGREHPVGRLARRFARRLEGRFGLATRLVDERLSSHAAQQRLPRVGAGRRKKGHSLDAVAAEVILQTYFASRQAPRG